jgi:hypothetical protein
LVEKGKEIDLKDISIIYKNDLQLNPEKDSFIIKNIPFCRDYQPRKVLIFSQGIRQNEIPNDLGNQELIVMYRNKEIGKISLWKTVNHHVHSYHVNIFKEDGVIRFKVSIDGPDAVTAFITDL